MTRAHYLRLAGEALAMAAVFALIGALSIVSPPASADAPLSSAASHAKASEASRGMGIEP